MTKHHATNECLKYHLAFILFSDKSIITSLILSTEAEVQFDRDSAIFSENSGDQSIFVVLQGGVLIQNLTVTIYDVDTSENKTYRHCSLPTHCHVYRHNV